MIEDHCRESGRGSFVGKVMSGIQMVEESIFCDGWCFVEDIHHPLVRREEVLLLEVVVRSEKAVGVNYARCADLNLAPTVKTSHGTSLTIRRNLCKGTCNVSRSHEHS